jgi:2-methylfumaryl-CoA isomerase
MVREDASCAESNPMFRNIDQPGVGRYLAPGLPLEFSAVPRAAPAPAPRLGEHTEEVLAGVLGIGSSEYGRLHDKGVVGDSAL